MLPGAGAPGFALRLSADARGRVERRARARGARQNALRVRTARAGDTSVPWADGIARRWTEILGDCAERDHIVHVMSHALTETTGSSYGRHFANFASWCADQPDRPPPLPATTQTVLRWLDADVCAGGKVQAQSLQPYLSAINAVHEDLDYDKPALGHAVRRYRRGIAHLRTASGRGAQRVYLPPAVVSQLLDWALSLDLSRASRGEIRSFRAAVAVVFTFSFFARGATGSRLLDAHVRRSVAGVTVTLAHEKGRATASEARTVTLPPGSIPGLEQLLERWEAFRGPVKPGTSYYALPGEKRRTFTAGFIDSWTRESLAQLDVQAPAGEKWSGHSLRKGAASGAAAIDVALHRICYMGGWSIHSRVVHDYIDPTCPASAACRRFYGWLRAH
jgi:predicted nucleic acid-binding protein